jgi:hypothetical protein
VLSTNRTITKLTACKPVRTPLAPSASQALLWIDASTEPSTPRLHAGQRTSDAWRGVFWPGLRDGRCARHGEVVGAFTAVCLRCHLEQLDAASRGSREWERPASEQAASPDVGVVDQRPLIDLADCADLAAGSGE